MSFKELVATLAADGDVIRGRAGERGRVELRGAPVVRARDEVRRHVYPDAVRERLQTIQLEGKRSIQTICEKTARYSQKKPSQGRYLVGMAE